MKCIHCLKELILKRPLLILYILCFIGLLISILIKGISFGEESVPLISKIISFLVFIILVPFCIEGFIVLIGLLTGYMFHVIFLTKEDLIKYINK